MAFIIEYITIGEYTLLIKTADGDISAEAKDFASLKKQYAKLKNLITDSFDWLYENRKFK